MTGHGCADPERYQLLICFAGPGDSKHTTVKMRHFRSRARTLSPRLESHMGIYWNALDVLADTPVVLLGPEQSMQEQDRVAHGLVGLRAIHLIRQFLPADAGR